MKRITSFLLGTVAVMALSSCGAKSLTTQEFTPKEPPTGENWTIMVYMCGGSDEHLHGTASKALEEMTKVKYPENIDVIIQTGGSYSWQLDGIDTNYIDRFEAQNGSLRLAERTDVVSMAQTSTLTDFLEWGQENYESEHYALIIHGSGANSAYGVAHDEPYLNESLNLQRISTAIDNADMEFDIIGFDADLMASVENASILSNHTEYLIASQEVMAPGGWNYKDWFNYIIENPTVRVEDVAKAACDTYMDKCKRSGDDEMATMSVTKLSEITSLTQAINGMAGEMCESLKSLSDASPLLSELPKTMSFGSKSADEGYSNMIDINDLAVRVSENADKTSGRVQEEMSGAVVYARNGAYRNEACGLSIFYPFNQSSDELPRYMEISPIRHYKEFIASIASHADTGSDHPNTHEDTTAFADYKIEKDRIQYVTVAGTTGLELNMIGNMDIVKSVNQRIYKKSDNGYMYLGNTKNVEENKEAGIFKTKNNFSAITLNGSNIQVYTVYEGNGYTVYTSPIKIEGEQKNLRFVAEHKQNGTSKYKIIGLYDSLGAGSKSSRYITPIRIYNHLTPLFREFSTNELVSGKVFKTWPLGARISEKSLKEGSYKTDFSVSYIYGDSFLSGSSEFDYTEGNITYK